MHNKTPTTTCGALTGGVAQKTHADETRAHQRAPHQKYITQHRLTYRKRIERHECFVDSKKRRDRVRDINFEQKYNGFNIPHTNTQA